MPEGPQRNEANALRIDAVYRIGAIGGLGDAALLDRFLHGEPTLASLAFEALVSRHGPMVLRVCRRALGGPQDAEDAAQATFLVLARRAGAIQGRDSLGPWLYGVARKVARRARADAARRNNRERPLDPNLDPPAPDDRAGAWADLYEELDRLPERQRSPLVLCHLEGLSQDEAAARLGWTVRTLQRRLSQGRARLRDRLSLRGEAVSSAVVAFWSEPPPAAPVAWSWGTSTARAAVGFAQGPTAVGVASTLAKGAITAMLWDQFRRTAVLLAFAGSAALGLTRAANQTNPTAPAKAEKPADPPAEPPLQRAYDGVPPDTARWRAAGAVVLDDATGQPISGAQVRVFEFVGLRFHGFTTDASGRVRFEYPDADDSGATLEARKPGYVPQRLAIGGGSKLPADATPTFRLRSGSTIGGAVVNEAGEPISGAKVVVTATRNEAPLSRPKVEGATEVTYNVVVETDDDGRWECDQVSPDASVVNTWLMHPDYVSGAPEMVIGRRTPPIAGLRAKTDSQVMKKGLLVKGRVTDAEGKPIAGAEVKDTTDSFSFVEFLRRARTDAEGRFQFHFEPEKRLRLTTTAPGFGFDNRTVEIKEEEGPLEIALNPARPLRARVVDPNGNPIPGVAAYISSQSKFAGVYLLEYTDSEGRFQWDDAPDRDVPLMISRKGYISRMPHEIRPTDGEVIVEMTPALELTIKVRDAADGSLVKPYAVEFGVVHPGTEEISWMASERRYIRTGDEYRHQLKADPPAVYRARIINPSHKAFLSREIKSGEGAVTLDVRMEPLAGEGLSGKVVTPDGTPVAGAAVVSGGGGIAEGKVERLNTLAVSVATDDQGRFAFKPLASPFPMAVVAEQGYVEVNEAPNGPIILKPWGRIEGIMRVGPKPGAGHRVNLLGRRVRPLDEARIHQSERTTADAEGRFTFARVMPGPDVQVEDTLVEVKAGETTRVTIGGVGRPVVGRLLPPDGVSMNDWVGTRAWINLRSDRPAIPRRPEDAPPDWADIWWNSEEGLAYRRAYVNRELATVGTDGAFRFEDVPAGEYRLLVQTNAGDTSLQAEMAFKIAEMPGGRSDEPFDLGELKPAAPKPGERRLPPNSINPLRPGE